MSKKPEKNEKWKLAWISDDPHIDFVHTEDIIPLRLPKKAKPIYPEEGDTVRIAAHEERFAGCDAVVIRRYERNASWEVCPTGSSARLFLRISSIDGIVRKGR